MQDHLKTVDDLLNRGEIKKAEVLLARYLRSELTAQQRAESLLIRARLRLRNARPDDAIDDLLASRELDAERFNRAVNIELLADCHLARFELSSVGFAGRDDTALAEKYYQQILAEQPDYQNRGWLHYQLGRIALSNNGIDVAQQQFYAALLAPSIVPALTAYCYERLGFIAFYEKRELSNAKGLLDKALVTYPVDEPSSWLVQVYILMSRVLREHRDYSGAVNAAERAVEIASANNEDTLSVSEALLALAEILSVLDNRARDTVTHLQRFLQISRKPLGVDVTWSRAHEMMGDAFFKLGQYEAASENYESALHYNPYHPWAHSLYYRIARSYYQQNAYTAVIETIGRLVTSASNDGEVIQDYRVFEILGNAHFALSQYDQAQDAYQKALAIASADNESLLKIREYLQLAQELS